MRAAPNTNIIFAEIRFHVQIHFSLSLCVYVESILRIHIYERIHLETTNKPPASYTYPGAIVTGVSQVLIFVLRSFICFSLFAEKSVDLRGLAFPSHRHYRARIWLRAFIRLFIARKFR